MIESLVEQNTQELDTGSSIDTFVAHSARSRGQRISVKLQNNVKGSETSSATFFENTILWEVRRQMSAEANIPMSLVRLFYNGGELLPANDNKTLQTLRIQEDGTIMVTKRVESEGTAQGVKLTENKRLTTDAHAAFTSMFGLYANKVRCADHSYLCTFGCVVSVLFEVALLTLSCIDNPLSLCVCVTLPLPLSV